MSNIDAASTTHSPDTTPTVPSGRPVPATDVTDTETTTQQLRAMLLLALRARDQAIDAQTSAEATVAAYAQQVAAQAAQIDRLTRAHAEEQRRAEFNIARYETFELVLAETEKKLGAEVASHLETQRRADIDRQGVSLMSEEIEKLEAALAKEKLVGDEIYKTGMARLYEIQRLQDVLDAEKRASQGLREVLQVRTTQLEAATRQLGLRTERDLRDTADTVPT